VRVGCGRSSHGSRFTGNIWAGVHGDMGKNYMRRASEFQRLCDMHIQGNLGYTDGSIRHYWHGSKKKRYYVERWDILVQNNFNPDLDIATDQWGVPFLTGTKPKLRDDIRKYFRARDEDGTVKDA